MKSESIKEITTALSKAQVVFKPIKRTEKVDYATSAGRKKYNYAPLDEVIEATREALSANGLAITQTTKLLDGNTILETLLSHSSGEWLSGELYVGKQDQAPQAEGSALTYKRRYGISAMLCVASEDDDDAEETTDRKEKVTLPVKAKVVTSIKPEVSPNAVETISSTTEGENDSGIPKNFEELAVWVASSMGWKDGKPARSWMVNKCHISEDKLDDIEFCYNEIKALQGWS